MMLCDDALSYDVLVIQWCRLYGLGNIPPCYESQGSWRSDQLTLGQAVN
jgi:hypothetical protein